MLGASVIDSSRHSMDLILPRRRGRRLGVWAGQVRGGGRVKVEDYVRGEARQGRAGKRGWYE